MGAPLAVMAPAGRRRHGRVRDPAPPRLRTAAAIVAAVPFLVHAWVALHGYFGQDDFLFTYRAAHADPLDFGFLFQDHNGHLVPGTYLLAWITTAVAPLDFGVATVPLLVMHGATLWLFWLVLTRLFGYRWSLLPAFAALAASPLILFPTIWWAFGIQLLPVLIAMAAALLAHLRYLDTGAPRHAVTAVGWVFFGLLFSEKAVLIGAVLFAVTVLRDSTVSETLVKHWRIWTTHIVVLVGFLALSSALTASQAAQKPVPARDVAEFAYRAVVDTFLPGILGGPFAAQGNGATWATPPLAVRVAAIAITIAIIAVSKKAKPWLFLAGYLTIDIGLVAVTRLADVGPAIGADPRYLADAVPVAILCATFAYQGKRDHRLPMIIMAALLVAGGTISFIRVAPALEFRDARDYVATARTALTEQPNTVLYDTTVPNSIIINWFIYDNFTSRVVGLLPEAKFDEPTENLYQLDDRGQPRKITTLTESVRGENGPTKDCGHKVDGPSVQIPLTAPSFGRRVLKLGYFTGDTGDGFITVGNTRAPVQFREGLHVLWVVVEGEYSHVDVEWNENLQPLCVTDVEIGMPAR